MNMQSKSDRGIRCLATTFVALVAVASSAVPSGNGKPVATKGKPAATRGKTTGAQKPAAKKAPASKSADFELPPLAEPVAGQSANRPITWKFGSEQEWIVDSTSRDIAEMLAFAKYHGDAQKKFAASDVGLHTVTVDGKTGSYTLDLALRGAKQPQYKLSFVNYAWSPQSYEPFAKQIIASLKLSPSAASKAPDNFLKNLAEADSAKLFAENERVSRELNASPLDAGLHEQAAMLQATFDMLELAGTFSDTRPPLSRISAHLAIARALNSDKLSPVGQLANIALESMSCRDGVAVTLVKDMEKEAKDSTVNSWLRALKIRSSGDFRVFSEKEQTPIEELQYGLRFAFFRNVESTLAYIQKHHQTLPVRWMRIVACGPGSVEAGHLVLSHIVPAEMSDYISDFKLYCKKQDTSEARNDLNRTPTRCLVNKNGEASLNVLSWDDVAAYHARHILSGVASEYYFYQYSYGVPEMAKESTERAKKSFSYLTLYPFTMQGVKLPEKEFEAAYFEPAQKVFLTHPELVTSDNWESACECAKKDAPNLVLLDPTEWFSPPMPVGTAYYFRDRAHGLNTLNPDLAELTELKKICPLEDELCRLWAIKKYGDNPTGDQLREAYGDLEDFNIHVMRLTALCDASKPDKFIPQYERISQIEPDSYFALGRYCVLHQMPDKAAEYFQQGFDKCENAVMVANLCDWLMRYRLSHGEKEKALQLAQFGADVYSQAGLMTLADYYERTGDLKSAEKLYRDIVERYKHKEELCAFLLRNAAKDPAYDTESKALVKEIFPNGMKEVSAATFKNTPSSGMWVKYEDWMQDGTPLKGNTVVVGVNGYAVETRSQCSMLCDLTLDPDIRVTLWDGKDFLDTKKPNIDNRLGLAMDEYKPSAEAVQMQKPLLNFLEGLNKILTDTRKKMEEQKNSGGGAAPQQGAPADPGTPAKPGTTPTPAGPQ